MIDAKTIFNAESKPPIELFAQNGIGLYIPSYQRPYSWDKEKVSRLLEDISFGFNNLKNFDDSFTFLGTVITIHDTNNSTVQPIVKMDIPAKVLTVIDGQQRMTSLLLLCINLHNKIKQLHKKLEKTLSNLYDNEEKSISELLQNRMDCLTWLNSLTQSILADLKNTFCEVYPYGESPNYPRMIRSIDDQWARSKAKDCRYESPIAKLTFEYISTYMTTDEEYIPYRRDKPIEGEEALVERFKQITKALDLISKGEDTEYDGPTPYDILNSENYNSLFNMSFPLEFLSDLNEQDLKVFNPLVSLVFYSRYILSRVVLTVVTGKNEDYAFSIFESLNTTGEPLTAFETFKPRVINYVGLNDYEDSQEKKYIDNISKYFSEFKVGSALQKETKDFLIYFFGSYAGIKASGRLSEQRNILKKLFEGSSSDATYFIQTMSNQALFMKMVWNENENEYKEFSNLTSYSLSPLSKLGLAYLKELKHTIVIPILTLFFIQIIEAEQTHFKNERFQDFEKAIKAIMSFTSLWRATKNGNSTSGIDNEYRELLSKVDMPSGLLPISKKLMGDRIININLFKKELKSRLCDSDRKGNIKNKDDFIKKAKNIPIYDKGKKIAKLLLLSAHHDSIKDDLNAGLLIKSKVGYNTTLTVDFYLDEDNLSLEHIVPQTNKEDDWPSSLYNDPTLIDTLGNLTLVSHSLNASLGNRCWEEKRIFYRVVGAETNEIAASILKNEKIFFADSTKELLAAQKYMPNLIALASIDTWSPEIIEKRSENLYALAWDKLISWLS